MATLVGAAAIGVIIIIIKPSRPPATPYASGALCPSEITDERLRCPGQVTDEDLYTWNVTKPGRYGLAVYPSSKSVAFKPGLLITAAAGAAVADVSGGAGSNLTTTLDAKAGVYTLKVFPSDGAKIKGGYAYELEISSVSGPPLLAAPSAPPGPTPEEQEREKEQMAKRQRLAVAAMERERAAIAAREGLAPVAAPSREGELTAPSPSTADTWRLTEAALFPAGRPRPPVAELLQLLAAPSDALGSAVSETEFRALLRDSRAAALDTTALMKKATPPDPPTGPRSPAPKQTPFVEIFMRPTKVTAATEFLAAHAVELKAAEAKHGVAPADITAILLWQSNLGQVTGDLQLFSHFLGQALFLPDALAAAIAAGHPDNAVGSHATLVEKAAKSSLQTAAALIRASKMKHLDVLTIRGIAGGGVGYAQFTPSGFRWLEDGNDDGVLQFDSYADAIMSIANCLEAGGYKADRKKGLLNYNPGDEWATGIQRVGDAIASEAQPAATGP